ncbi:MAG: response regulator [Desulfuromonadales bacterium]
MARILLIDDDAQLLKVMEITLQKSGHEIFPAPDGKVALNLLKTQPVDLIITDIVMPEADGIEVISSFIGTESRPPIIAISGGSQRLDPDSLLKLARAMKVDLAIAKPFTPLELLKAVDTVLAKL